MAEDITKAKMRMELSPTPFRSKFWKGGEWENDKKVTAT